ncbi:MAG: caspase family protein [Deltaproteobacteria bacterium]|nr:caspase family protein [Deltaproteobacteria bacterium]
MTRAAAAGALILCAACAGGGPGPAGRNAPVAAPAPPVSPSPAPAATERGLELVEQPPAPGPLTAALQKARSQYARRLGVTVGIDAYGKPWPPLAAAVADARRMAELMRALGFDEVESLENEQATRAGILDLIERRLPSRAAPKDLVVIYFAGHGHSTGERGFVVPQDATAEVEQTGLSVQQLKETALRLRARHVLYLVDACFSGSMFRRPSADQDTNDFAFWENAAAQRVVQIATAGGPGETVLEKGGWGAFTRMLHAALQGPADANRDGVITVPELAGYVVPRVAQDTGGHQHPLWGAVEGTGTVLLWDERRVPAEARKQAAPGRVLVAGMEDELRRVHELMGRQDWKAAEALVRELALRSGHVELSFLLAEIYLAADPLGNAALAEAELRHAEGRKLGAAEERRLLDLRARLEKARRGPY